VSVVPYCSDEDVAVRAPADYATLCAGEVVARGGDGTFLASDRWTLRSAAVDFAACGLRPGHVVQLTQAAAPNVGAFGQGELFGVVLAATGSVTLRRRGLPPGAGMPPAPPAGLAGVAFAVPTLATTIEEASHQLDQRYGVDDLRAGRRHVDQYDPRVLRAACVLSVLADRYLACMKQPGDDFDRKAQYYRSLLDELLAWVVLRWLPDLGPGPTGLRVGRVERG
jgi:hypothetical protein